MPFTSESARAAREKRRTYATAAPKLAPTEPPAPPVVPRSGELDWWKMPLSAAEVELTRLRDQLERAVHILESRRSQLPRKKWICAICAKPMEDGQWKFKDDSRRDPQTGMVDPAVVCSIDCFTRYNVKRQFARAPRR